MWFPRLAKSLHKFFQTQFLFGTKIKSTYKNVLGNTKILDLSVKRESQRPIPVLGPRQKWVDFPPTFFELFINFLVVTFSLSDHVKIFSIFDVIQLSKAKMSRFAPNIFLTFYQFSGSFSLIFEYSKKICGGIFPFRQDMAHFDFERGQKSKILKFFIKQKMIIWCK